MTTMQVISEGYNNDKPFVSITNPSLIPRMGEVLSHHPYNWKAYPDWNEDEMIDAVTIKTISYLYEPDGSVIVTIWI
jgi:hypothetical protein